MSANGDEAFLQIVACPRSGTYLLTSMLNAHPEVAIPLETHFIPVFHPFRRLWGDLGRYENRNRLFDCIFDFLAIFIPRNERAIDWDRLTRISLLCIEEKKEEILASARTYAEISRALFREYARLNGASIYGDKTAPYSRVDVHQLQQCLGNIKLLHIVRDGRDVCSSWMREWFRPRTFFAAARLWKQHVDAYQEWGSKNRQNYLEIRYEDLVSKPEETMRRVYRFLDIEGDLRDILERREESSFARTLASGLSHGLLTAAPRESNATKWKQSMTPQRVAAFEMIAGETLSRAGYERVEVPLGVPARAYLRLKIEASRLVSPFLLHYVKKNIEAVLPVVLYAGSYLRRRRSA